MQLLFVILFGVVVSFILYLSYHTHVIEKKEKTNKELIKKDEVIETENISKEETIEKVLEKEDVSEVIETVKFKAKRNKKNKEEGEEEII